MAGSLLLWKVENDFFISFPIPMIFLVPDTENIEISRFPLKIPDFKLVIVNYFLVFFSWGFN